jgi:hypothetical protein
MKKLIFALFVGILMAGCNGDEVPAIKGNVIEFKAECNTDCSASAFIDRNREIVWQETVEFTDNFELSHTTELQEGDKVLLFVMPRDGEVHIIKTEIFIDGVLQANQNKVCHAGGGCSFTKE